MDKTQVWTVMILLGLGSFGLRFMFTGWIGDRPMPEWVLRHLRYTAVAILPALVGPMVVWPEATNGTFEPVHASAAVITVIMGYVTRNVFAAILFGAAWLYAGLYLFN